MRYLAAMLTPLLALVTGLQAQRVVVLSERRLELPAGSSFPRFSPDDRKVYSTSADYRGITELDLTSRVTRQLTDDPGAGYQFQVTSDGRKLIYRRDNFASGRRRSALIALDLKTLAKTTLAAEQVDLSPPQLTAAGDVFFTRQQQPQLAAVTSRQLPSLASLAAPLLRIREQKMVVYAAGQEQLLDPLPEGSYFWESLSPDGSKILFTEARRGTFVASRDGAILAALGKANAPQWSPDGRWILCMDDRDNGEILTASDLWLISADGRQRLAIPGAPERIEIYPRWAHQSMDKILFGTADGEIFLLEFRIEE